jgi:hypothetical protein
MGNMRDYFSAVEVVGEVQAITHPGRTLNITVYRVSNWRE